MRILIAVAVVLSLLVTIFAVQNNQPTTVKFLFWSVDGSSALVLMVTLIAGVVVGVLLMIPGSVRNRLRVAELNRNLRGMKEQLPPQAPPEAGPSSPGAAPAAEAGGSTGVDPAGEGDG